MFWLHGTPSMSAMRPAMLAGPMFRHSSRSKDLISVVASSGFSGVGVGDVVWGVAVCCWADAANDRHNSTAHASVARKCRLFVSGMICLRCRADSVKTWVESINHAAAARPQSFMPAVFYLILCVGRRLTETVRSEKTPTRPE